ncbi:hypothetical protein [Chitinophaga sp. S165]|uniref:hypothetical protein n=1 Tax=Chitinophaga sp. S165 TaxID=2135462 RepID=UPI000D70E1C8|nr:hypothetical protein [Chitinophaga sp. S165]PWV46157.1 hypothetical protein C7475_11160 [Chitinophaga sp. S165]
MRTNYFTSNILLAACLLVLTISVNAQQSTSSTSNYSSDGRNGKSRITINDDDKTYHMEFVDDKLSFLSVDGILVPQEKWGDYKKIVDSAIAQMKKDREQARLDRIQAEKDREQARLDRLQADKDRQQALRDRAQAEKDREQAIKDRSRADQDKNQRLRDKEQADRDRLQADRDREQAERDRVQADKDREQAVRDRAQAEKDREQAVRDRLQAEKDREQAARDRVQAEKDRAQAAADRKLLDEMMADMVSDKLINSAADLRLLTLTPTEITVNGIKQPDAVHKKYQDKYPRFAKNSLTYSSNGQNRNMQMSGND